LQELDRVFDDVVRCVDPELRRIISGRHACHSLSPPTSADALSMLGGKPMNFASPSSQDEYQFQRVVEFTAAA